MTAINPVTDLTLDGDVAVITLNSPPVNALSAAVRQGSSSPESTPGESGAPCVGAGQTMGRPSRRAVR